VNPQDLLYTKTHEWTRVESSPAGEKIATVGITAFAYELLTDLVFVALPELGKSARADAPLGEIESVKAVSDFNSPVDGEVVAVNAEVPENLEQLPQDPYGRWWFVKIKITNETSLKKLMDAAAYEKQCTEEQH
jgi:glycine cleavage system H protein